jgi:HEAT repeat protein
MAKRTSTEEKLMALKKAESASLTPELRKDLCRALSAANNIVVANVAKIVGNRAIDDCIPDLLKAFERFLKNPLKSDKGCLAKEAIIGALDTLEYDRADIFLQGIRYFQVEPAYLRPTDTAAVLRGLCAFALVRLGHPEVVFELTDLLADPEPQARIAAVRALAGVARDQGEPLLRLKAQLKDDDHRVVAECLSVLVQINPERSLGFVERFLSDSDLIIAENAAFALGESRREEAFEILRRHREDSMNSGIQAMLLMPMAITRLEEAFEYLIDVIENADRDSAAAAAKAIEIFSDESHRARIRAIGTFLNDAEV